MILHFPYPTSSSSLHGLKFLHKVRSHSRMVITRSEAGSFNVTTTRKEIVVPNSAPLVPLPENKIISLSNLDLLLPPVDVNVCFFYTKPLHNTTNDALKMALAKALVSYNVLAGEVVANPITGEPEILCSDAGVEVVEAAADVELLELNLYDPYQSIAKFVPMKKHGVFAIQVTELRCGSLVVGCTFDHRIADAYSMNMFLLSWAEISRSNVPTANVPSFNRSLLNPKRRPLIIDSSLDQMYMPVTSLPLTQETTNPDNILTSRIYYIKADVIQELQTLAGNGKRTKLESFSAFLWKLVAKHAATTDSKILNSKLGIVVDGRKKLMEQETNTYFGNVLSIPFGEQSIHDLTHKPLSYVADEVHKVLESSVTKDHFLNLIDWIETHRPVPVLSRIYGAGPDDGPAFVVSSGRSFPVTRIDFGWGSPVFGSYHLPRGSRTGYVMTMPSPLVDNSAGDWIVYLHLAEGQLEFIEQEAPHV